MAQQGRKKRKGIVIDEKHPELSIKEILDKLIEASADLQLPEAKKSLISARDEYWASHVKKHELIHKAIK